MQCVFLKPDPTDRWSRLIGFPNRLMRCVLHNVRLSASLLPGPLLNTTGKAKREKERKEKKSWGVVVGGGTFNDLMSYIIQLTDCDRVGSRGRAALDWMRSGRLVKTLFRSAFRKINNNNNNF